MSKILFARLFLSYTDDTIIKAFKVDQADFIEKKYYTPKNVYNDPVLFEMLMTDIRDNNIDSVFTVNFWPLVANVCNELSLPYIAWSYDCPQNLKTNDCMDFETNYIYLFDRSEVEQYRKEGLSRVFHMPLATDPDLFDKMSAGKDTAGIKRNLTSEISFVGNLYTSYDYNAMLLSMPENSYFKGYIRGLVSAQSNLFNYWIIPDLINDKVTRYVKNETGADELTRKQLVFLIANYITYKDRLMILKMAKKVSDDVALYSYKVNDSEKSMLSSVDIRPSVDYLTEMPYVFRHSKINLCPTLRCIGTGIPLRMLDIMASHGFLLCNAQSELMEYFDSNDCAMYSSYEEAYDLMQFFIRNDGIRERCVENAYAKIQAAFRMDDRIKMIFEMSNVKL